MKSLKKIVYLFGLAPLLMAQPLKAREADPVDPLLKASEKKATVHAASAAQGIPVTGTVTEADGSPLPGVSVMIKGTRQGTVTDINGAFSITIPSEESVLVFSFVGYATQEVMAGSQLAINVTLSEGTHEMEEVVVIGYGTLNRRNLTGAISSVSGKDLSVKPVSSAAEALTGQMAGVQVITTEGSLDARIQIRIRGSVSITQAAEPLYIVDGFPVNSISDIAPNDIASIDVLKDASASAIYGSRGANGVVIITTKSAKEGKVTINYNGFAGIRRLSKRLEVLSAYDYALWQYERQLLDGLIGGSPTPYTNYFGNWRDIDMYRICDSNDWLDIVFGNTGTAMNHNLSVNGGTDKIRYNFSYNRVDEKAIAKGSNFSRDNLALKVINTPHKRVQLEYALRWSLTKMRGPSTNDGSISSRQYDARLRNVMIFPSVPVEQLEITDIVDNGFLLFSPLVSLRDGDRMNQRRNLNMNGAASWEFIDGIRFRTEAGLDHNFTLDECYYGVTADYVRRSVPSSAFGRPAIIFNENQNQTIRNTNTLNVDFRKWMPKSHRLNLLLGQEYFVTTYNAKEMQVVGFDFKFDLDLARRLTNQGTAYTTSNFFAPDNKLFSFFSRANYDYEGKYLLSATFRADGSSKFAKGNRWGYFPSVSAAWRVSSESFMEGTKGWLNDLKIRASYGTAGNNNIPAGQMSQIFNTSATLFVNGYTFFWAPSNAMANPDLTWETTITRNIGLDWTLLGSKLSGTFDLYRNNTVDVLINFPTPGTGYNSQFRNMGEIQNEGAELSMKWEVLNTRKMNISMGANIGFNRNKLISMGSMDVINGQSGWGAVGTDFVVEAGKPIGQMFGYRVDGRYEVDDFDYNPNTEIYTLKPGVADCGPVIGTRYLRPGAMKLKDKLGEGKVGLDNDSREIIGDANPVHTGGFNINMRAYGFDLGMYFNWTYGNKIYNANKIEWTSTYYFHSRNMLDVMADGKRWTSLDKTTGRLITDPAALADANDNTTMWSPWSNYVITDWAIEDGSFLRLNTLTLGYTFPSELTKKTLISNLRVYATGYNVFCWTNYSGFDPEVSTRRAVPYTPGVDFAAYPRSRQIVFGINVTF